MAMAMRIRENNFILNDLNDMSDLTNFDLQFHLVDSVICRTKKFYTSQIVMSVATDTIN